MKQILLTELEKLKGSQQVDQEILKQIEKYIKTSSHFIKETNPTHHFCSFFLPVNVKTKQIFLTHHIKANDWIPPGGHIEIDESPIETVRREFGEELGHTLQNEKIELFNLSFKDVTNPKYICQVHYDFWYLVHTDVIDFKWDPGEFYDAQWMTIEEGLKRITKNPNCKEIIKKIGIY